MAFQKSFGMWGSGALSRLMKWEVSMILSLFSWLRTDIEFQYTISPNSFDIIGLLILMSSMSILAEGWTVGHRLALGSVDVCSPDCSNGNVGDAAAGGASAGCAGTVGDYSR
jgi:hypothetical protein